MWFIIIFLSFAVAVTGAIFLLTRIRKFSFIKKIEVKYTRKSGWLVSIIIIAICAISAVCFMGAMNAIVVIINLAVIWLVCDGLHALFNRKRVQKTGIYYAGIVAIVLTALYFFYGYFSAHNVVETRYEIAAKGEIEPLKIALISDAHVGTTMSGNKFAEQMNRISEQNPDVVIVAGDLIDDSTGKADMIQSCEALGKMTSKSEVYYVFGNHDKGYASKDARGYDTREFTDKLEECGVRILEDELADYGDDYCIIGRADKGNSQRKNIKELVSEMQPGRFTIVVDHQPSDYDAETEERCNLVLSGHTHGGQLIPITKVGEWIGSNDATYGLERRGETDFIVSSGIGDWELWFKSGCKAEYVIISIE